jgi:hypothetical protein
VQGARARRAKEETREFKVIKESKVIKDSR